jgi:NAD(P)-dependent dehydrogenase (short-subunit alcohol dehydrogenase family)
VGVATAPPLERLGTPADIAEVVAFLASRLANGSTGRSFAPTAESSELSAPAAKGLVLTSDTTPAGKVGPH